MLFVIKLQPSWMRNLALEKEISKSHWILSEKSVLDDFTLQALTDFTQCTNTCGSAFLVMHFQQCISHILTHTSPQTFTHLQPCFSGHPFQIYSLTIPPHTFTHLWQCIYSHAFHISSLTLPPDSFTHLKQCFLAMHFIYLHSHFHAFLAMHFQPSISNNLTHTPHPPTPHSRIYSSAFLVRHFQQCFSHIRTHTSPPNFTHLQSCFLAMHFTYHHSHLPTLSRISSHPFLTMYFTIIGRQLLDRHPPHHGFKMTSNTPDIHHTRQVWCDGCSFVYTRCGVCLVWWMCGVVDVWCGGCPILQAVWWMTNLFLIFW